MLTFQSIEELVTTAQLQSSTIGEVVLQHQARELDTTASSLMEKMSENLAVMEEAVAAGMRPGLRSTSGLSGGDAYKLQQAMALGKTLGGTILDKALTRALAISEVNACMGRIVAAPTAGSCGILPAVVLTAMEERNICRDRVVISLFTAAGIGMVIAKTATISGAEGGCQAECGSAAAMAAAALVELGSGTPRQAANACAIALKNVMGLICDPVAGLVEVPCIKRNALGAANALVAADMALAGIESLIPADEVIAAMKAVGRLMPPALRETAEGGLAATPTARRLEAEILGHSAADANAAANPPPGF